MYKYEDIRMVHLEVTERCQAGCPMCGRFDGRGGLNRHLTEASLSLEDFKRIFDDEFISKLQRLWMCGNFGDPIVAPDTMAIFEHLRDRNFKMQLDMFTNGGAKPKEWWRDLASLLTPETRSKVVFAIDGLEDTNHLYRRGVKWGKVIESVEAFVGAGGAPEWHYLVFKHNEHQIEEARSLAKSLGFKKFRVKKTTRFDDSKTYENLELPKDASLRNDKYDFLVGIKNTYGSYDQFLDKTPIKCMVKDERSVYVSARGELFPCCWLGYDPYGHHVNDPTKSGLFKYIKDFDAINALKRPMKDIFDSGYFDRIEDSWTIESVAEGRVKTCAKTCSLNNFYRAQFA